MTGGLNSLFHRLGFVIPFLCALAALAGAWSVPEPDPLALALAALGGFAAAWARLRHGSLALSAALAPLPGILWFGASAYALCIALAIMLAAAYGDAMLKEEDGAAALVRPLVALAGVLLFALLWSLHAAVQLRSLLAASSATVLCLPPLALGVGFSEETIIRGNRQREASLRIFASVARIAEPRWAISLSGVGLVLAVLGYFEIAAKPPPLDWLAAPLAAAIVLAFTRDQASGLAALAASALLLPFIGGVGGGLLLFLLFALCLSRAAAACRREGDAAPAAWTRAIEGLGGTVFFAGLAAIIAAGPRGGIAAAVHAGCGLAAALFLFPAFAVAFAHFFPDRRSLEELYRA